MTAAFMAIGLIATNVLLAIHLLPQTACQACDHDSNHEHDDDSPAPHDHDNCLICQVLFGPGGKYLNITQAHAVLVSEQPPQACDIQYQIIKQNTPGIADARGPPCVQSS